MGRSGTATLGCSTRSLPDATQGASGHLKLHARDVDTSSMPTVGSEIPAALKAEEPPTLARLLRAIPDVVIVSDGEGNVLWVNTAAERFFGTTLAESRGVAGLDFVHPEDAELVLRSLASISGKEIGAPIEVRFRAASGWRLMELIGTPVPWIGSDALLFTLRDLTERRRFELAHNQDARFRSMVQNSGSLTLLISRHGDIESASATVTRRLGHDPELLEGHPLADLVVEADRPALAGAFERAGQGATATFPVTVQVALLRQGNRGSVPYELSFINLVDDPTVAGFVVTGHDTAARTLAEFELRKAQSLLTATLDATADGILVVDSAGRFASFNRNFVDMWRIPDSIALSRDDARAIAFVREQLVDPDAFVARIGELYKQPEAESLDTLEFLDGRVFERYSTPQRLEDRTIGRVWSFRDMTDRKRLEERLSYQSLHDPLTALGNRVLFLDRLQHASARLERSHGRLAVLVVDIDDMSVINDNMGNAVGDCVLLATAERLLGCLRSSDTAARLGGDEFGILVEDVAEPGEVARLAERVLAALRLPLQVVGTEISVTASIGVALDHLGRAGDHLLTRAATWPARTPSTREAYRVTTFGTAPSRPLMASG